MIAFACIFGGALLGMFIRRHLPEHHLSDDSRDVMKLGIGMIATLSALVLGLLTASAKGTFDTMNNGLRQAGLKIVLLDRSLARYGPETREIRNSLQRGLDSAIQRIWFNEKKEMGMEKFKRGTNELEHIDEKIRKLSPQNDEQRQLQVQAVQISSQLQSERWLLIEETELNSLPLQFIVLLICWLTIIFCGFGLLTVSNKTVIGVLFICALSAASTLFLIQEMDHPYTGVIKLSSAPLVKALALLGQ